MRWLIISLTFFLFLMSAYVYADSNTTLLIHSDETDGSQTFSDSSDASNAINYTGQVMHSTNTSQIGSSSIYFDGSGDYLTVSASSNWDFGTSPFTIDFWINGTDSGYFAASDASNPSNAFWGFNVNRNVAGKMQFFSYSLTGTFSNGEFLTNATTEVSDGDWHHIAIVREGTLFAIYVDGSPEGTAVSSNALDSSAYDLDIGLSSSLGLTGTNAFEGYIDEFRISNIVRTSDPLDPLYIDDGESSFAVPLVDYGIYEAIHEALISDTIGFEAATIDEMNQLAQLYLDGKEGLIPEAVTIGDNDWNYFSGDLPGDVGGTTYDIGDSWVYGGMYYIKLGSGLGTAVPELPPFAAQGLMMMFGGVGIWFKRKFR